MPFRPLMSALALVLTLGAGASAHAAAAPAATWFTKLDEAMAAAKKSGRPILADFTGSDWCHWCKQLDKEVFETSEFETWAAAHVVLLQVDFPQRKPQSAELKQQNQALQQRFQVQGFPTVVVLDATGEKRGELGYQAGGAARWIARCAAIAGVK
jgi:protein disulfide-isomerase